MTRAVMLSLLLGFPWALSQAQSPPPVTAFVDVAVIPMDRERVLPHQTVVVRGGRIVELGPTAKVRVPAGAVRIDGRQKFLIPGLADMHAHTPGIMAQLRATAALGGDLSRMMREQSFTPRANAEVEHMLLLYAANGVTTVRIMHGTPEILALRARVAKGELFSPRIYAATPIIGAAEKMPDDAPDNVKALVNGLHTPDEAVKVVETAKATGYDFVKLYGVNGVLLDSLAAAARRVGLPIAGHVPGNPSEWDGGKGLKQALRAGYASIEHLSGFRGAGWFETDVGDTAALRMTAAVMRKSGVWNCPTQMVDGFNLGYFTSDTVASWPEMRYVTDSTLQDWKKEWNEARSRHAPSVGLQGMMARRQIIKALRDAGAGLLLGTDASVSGVIPGFSVHRELMELVKAGLTPYEALVTGTRNVAAYFGALDSTGTIAAGKRADLVLLTDNPLRDIRATTRRAGVMLGGRWVPQDEIERRLAPIEGTLF